MLEKRDLQGLTDWAAGERRSMSILISFLYERDPLIAWRAVEGLGRVALIKTSEIESLRNIIRRLLWTMNDESGSVGWYSAQAIGEIIFNVPELIDEYARILACFHDLEPFREGVFWAVAKLASIRPEPFADLASDIEAALADSSPVIRAHAALILAAMGRHSALDTIHTLNNDLSRASIYNFESGELEQLTVARMAARALDQLARSSQERNT